jgi:hypothetical protein
MQTRCLWELAPAFARCAVGDCPRDARFFCQEHPSEGPLCATHRRDHTRSVAKRNAQLDSRPRDAVLTLKPIKSFGDLLAAVNGGLIREGAPLV